MGDISRMELKYIYALRYGKNSEIKKFTLEGELVSTWTAGGFGEGKFYNPNGVVVDGCRETLLSATPEAIASRNSLLKAEFIESLPIQYAMSELQDTNNGDFLCRFTLQMCIFQTQFDRGICWGSGEVMGTGEGQFNDSLWDSRR